MAIRPRQQPRRSKTPFKQLEDEIRVGVFDQGDVSYNDDPHLIVPNGKSGCYGLYMVTPDGIEFMFHHAVMEFATGCLCLERKEPGDSSFQISPELDSHRLRLMRLKPYRLGPILAAMVVMKLYVGLEVPEPFRLRQLSEIPEAESQNTSEEHQDGK